MEQVEVQVASSYLDIFDKLIEKEVLLTSTINLFSIKIQNKEFNYDLLANELINVLISFCMSQKKLEELVEKKKYGTLSQEARKLFKEYRKVKDKQGEYTTEETKDGELGELILYSFMETHLEAPKILTKMRLKTSTNDPVKRSDGIHLLQCEENYFELIYCESKLYKDLKSGLENALQSIYEFKTRNNNNINDEFIFLLDNIESEFKDDNYEFLKDVLIPSQGEKDFDVSFGVFVGFEIEVPLEIKAMTPKEFKEKIKELIKQDVSEKVKVIKGLIPKLELDNHNIYIYLVPFTNLNQQKLKILQSILE